jgi:hypothetical protein
MSKIEYQIEVAATGRRNKVWRVIGKRDGVTVYRGYCVYRKAVALLKAVEANEQAKEQA